jgi:hypothetical protein
MLKNISSHVITSNLVGSVTNIAADALYAHAVSNSFIICLGDADCP